MPICLWYPINIWIYKTYHHFTMQHIYAKIIIHTFETCKFVYGKPLKVNKESHTVYRAFAPFNYDQCKWCWKLRSRLMALHLWLPLITEKSFTTALYARVFDLSRPLPCTIVFRIVHWIFLICLFIYFPSDSVYLQEYVH